MTQAAPGILRLTVLAGGMAPRDVAVRMATGATAADLAEQLARELGSGPLSGPGGLPGVDDPVRAPGLRDGDAVGLGVPAPPAGVAAEVELLVVSGPGAGSAYPLAAGPTVVGGDPPGAATVDLRLPDPSLGRAVARLDVSATTVLVTPLAEGALLGGDRLDGPATWQPGTLLDVGDTSLALAVAGQPPQAALAARPDGTLALARPPRLLSPAKPARLDVPLPPQPRERTRVPLLAVLAPLALAGGLFAWNPGAPQYLLFGLLSPAMVLGTVVSDRRGARRSLREGMARFAAAQERFDQACRRVRAEQETADRSAAPDPATLCRWARLPATRLWERRPGEPDWLRLRVGTADRPARVELRGRTYGAGPLPLDGPPPESAEPPLLRQVPVTLDLPEIGVLGVAGSHRLASARWLLGQLAALHLPGEVRIQVLAPNGGEAWSWLGWLPHRVGLASGDAAAAALADLAGQLPDAAAGAPAGLVLLADDVASLRRLPGWARLLRHGPAAGVLTICLEADARALPEECAAVLHAQPGAGRLEVRGQPAAPVQVDAPAHPWAEQLARAVAPLRPDTADADDATNLPAGLRWLDVVGRCAAPAISDCWALRPHGRTDVVLGRTGAGPWTLDLAGDGPHALVAGTTGSGKSELLQTWIAALACANPPSALTLLLVDYKGGAAFGRCADLPHSVGLLTDLDSAGTARALASLRAELKRREALLAAAGARDLVELQSSGAGTLPRLVIVVDEFAALAEDLPDFVSGLVGIAQRGRSLGVHLILATQRPGGVVSADIKANTAIRIALRVTDPGESLDVVDCRDAALLPARCPGRAVVRTPGGTQTVQAGWLGGAPASPPMAERMVEVLDWGTLLATESGAAGPAAPSVPERRPAPAGSTDLDAVVDDVVAASRVWSARRGRAAAVEPPWLPPLPERVTPPDLPAADGAAEPLRVAVGRCDLPDRQAQPARRSDLAHPGTVLVVGAPRSGRTSTVRTVVGQLARLATPDALHLHVIDTGGSLQDLVGLPHAGVVAGPGDVGRLVRLIDVLADDVRRRRAELAERGHADLTAWRQATPGEAPPYLLLGIDGWQALPGLLDEVDHGAPLAALLDLLQDGPAAGLRAVVTSDRSALTGRLSALAEQRWLLRLADRADWGLAGVPASAAPATMPPGRCMVLGAAGLGPGPVECQLALTTAGDLVTIGGVAPAISGERRPLRLDPLPRRVLWSEATRLPGCAAGPVAPRGTAAAIAVGGDRLSLVRTDLSGGFLVVGPPGSGRSNALEVIEHSLAESGHPAVRICPRAPVDWEPRPDAAVLVDDVELLDEEAANRLESLLSEGRPVVAAATPDAAHTAFRGLIPRIRRNRRGLLLWPRRLDGDLLGVGLRGALVGAAAGSGAGRAVLVDRGRTQLVQVPLLDRT